MPEPNGHDLLERLQGELRNFEDIAQYLRPQPEDLPRLDGMDIYGGTRALRGAVGGDHIIYLDFKQRYDLTARIAHAEDAGRLDVAENLRRCQRTAGIAVIDVSGHRVTDALPAAMLHQALLLGAVYELEISGQITKRLFEHLNERFHSSSSEHKFVSLIYGEISEDTMFRFLSAAQPFPLVFSAQHDRFMEVAAELRVSFPPLGLKPSLDVIDRLSKRTLLGFKDHYQMNEWVLMGAGDILLLYTDGLAEHRCGEVHYCPDRLEDVLRDVKTGTARQIFDAIEADVQRFNEPSDDISLVVVKRN